MKMQVLNVKFEKETIEKIRKKSQETTNKTGKYHSMAQIVRDLINIHL